MSSDPLPALPRDLDLLPEGLRNLVRAEIAAGNSIAETGGPPAPPVGLSVRLARPVAAERRTGGPGFTFYDRNSSLWSGEFTDPERHFFVLEPPRPPPPEPDMDAIRARTNAAASAGGTTVSGDRPIGKFALTPADPEDPRLPWAARTPGEPAGAVARFVASRNLDYNAWKEGTSYDLAAIAAATPAERRVIEALLVDTPPTDWRDVEALAALGTPGAEAALRRALASDRVEVRLAVLRHAPGLVTKAERTRALVEALETVQIFGGLDAALGRITEYHPPAVREALWRGLLEREGDVATHFAAMLLYLGGRASSPFDWNHRPLFLRFNTADPEQRLPAFRELCGLLGEDADRRLERIRAGAEDSAPSRTGGRTGGGS